MARTTLKDPSQGIQDVLGDDIDTVLRERFFAPAFVEEPDRPGPRRAVPEAKARPEHYKVICISLYTDERLALVCPLRFRSRTAAGARLALSTTRRGMPWSK
jgi:hypothetical protein